MMLTIKDWSDQCLKQASPQFMSSNHAAWHGDSYPGPEWGIVWSWCPNSDDILSESNYQSLIAILEKKHPHSYFVAHFNHWLVGKLDHVMLKLRDKRGLTRAARTMYNIYTRYEDYPVIDEMHYSELETEYQFKAIENLKHWYQPDTNWPEGWQWDLWSAANNHSWFDVDAYLSKDQFNTLVKELGYAV